MIGPQFGYNPFFSTLARIIPTFLLFCHAYHCGLTHIVVFQIYHFNCRVRYLYTLFWRFENTGNNVILLGCRPNITLRLFLPFLLGLLRVIPPSLVIVLLMQS